VAQADRSVEVLRSSCSEYTSLHLDFATLALVVIKAAHVSDPTERTEWYKTKPSRPVTKQEQAVMKVKGKEGYQSLNNTIDTFLSVERREERLHRAEIRIKCLPEKTTCRYW
jgi:hypothetical protein